MLEGSRRTTTGSGKVCAVRGMMKWRDGKDEVMMMTVMKDGLDDTGRGCCRASAVAYATWLEPVVTMDDNELENYRGSNKNFT